MSSRPVCNALWIGSSLGRIEQACLSSFVDAGHQVQLHVYQALSGVPRGVNVVDATTILPPETIIRYTHTRTGGYSLFSNRFRYELLKAARGVWIDCDVLCLRPIADAAFIFGRQDESLMNGAVLKLPADHAVLAELRAMFTTKYWIPPWLSLRPRIACAIRYRTQRNFGIADMGWGTTGPRALTYYLSKHRLTGRGQPVDVFYPVGWRESDLLTARDLDAVRARLTPRTSCVHLWTQARSERNAHIEPGSFLDAVIDGSWPSVLSAGSG